MSNIFEALAGGIEHTSSFAVQIALFHPVGHFQNKVEQKDQY